MDPIAIDCARTIIDRLASAPSQAETRRKALEEAAKWHNQQEENNRAAMASASHSNSGDHIVAMYRYIAQTHANSAERIRSLATGEPA